MSSDSPESAHHVVSLFLHGDILSVCAWIIAWDTEWIAVDINLA